MTSHADHSAPSSGGERPSLPEVDHVVLGRHDIHRRVHELAAEITATCNAQELTILAVMTGSLIFLADLVRAMPVRVRMNLVSVSSYGAGTQAGAVQMLSALPPGLAGADVLIVDDILDTGATLSTLIDLVRKSGAHRVRTCVLLRKGHARACEVRADFVGFDIADEFVVGYGLDFDHLYRNLPEICVLKQHAGSKRP